MRVNSKTSSSPGRAPLIHTLCLKQCCNSPPHTQISLSNHSTEKISFSIPGPKWITKWERNMKNNLSYCQTLLVPSLVPSFRKGQACSLSNHSTEKIGFPYQGKLSIITWKWHTFLKSFLEHKWIKEWERNMKNNLSYCQTLFVPSLVPSFRKGQACN
jgi:hypothetical protein